MRPHSGESGFRSSPQARVKGRLMLLFEDHRNQPAAIDHKAVVYAVAFSPDGSTLATGAKDGSLLLRDCFGHVSPLRERGVKPQPVHAISYLPNNAGVVIGGEFGWSGWRLEGEVWTQFGPQSTRPVTSLAVLSERTVAFGFRDRLRPTAAGTFEIWDISADRKLLPYFHEPNGVRAVASCPAKKLVAWATGHRKVCVWDITTSKPTAYPQKHDCLAVALSADGRAMAVAVDYTARIYDVEKKRERVVLEGHKGKVATVAFSPDGNTLMTGGWDQTVRLWDVATGLERANYNWDIGRVYCATYAPDGLRLAAGGDLGRVVVWDAE
jgi:WD40 repeat protein